MDVSILKGKMKEKGYNTTKLSALSGLSKFTIDKIIYQERKNPGIHTIQKLAAALECSIDELIYGPAADASTPAASHTNSLILTCFIPTILPNGDVSYENPASESVRVPQTPESEQADFALLLTNNRLSPYFQLGDILLLKRAFPSNGQPAIFIQNKMESARIYSKSGQTITLSPIAKADSSIQFPEDAFPYHCLGTILNPILLK